MSEMPAHKPPKYVILVGGDPATAIAADAEEIAKGVIARACADNPGVFVDAYQHVGAMHKPAEADNGNAG